MEVNYGTIGGIVIIIIILFLWWWYGHRRKKSENQVLASEKAIEWDDERKVWSEKK